MTVLPFVLAASLSWGVYLMLSLRPAWLTTLSKAFGHNGATGQSAVSDETAPHSISPPPTTSKQEPSNSSATAPSLPFEPQFFNGAVVPSLQVHELKLATLESISASPAPTLNVAATTFGSKSMAGTGARSTTDTVVLPDQNEASSQVLFTGANYSIGPQHGLRLGFHLRNNQAKPAQGKVYASARYLHRNGHIELIDGRPYPFPFTVKHIAPAAISFLPSVTDGAFVDLLIDVRNLNGESLTHREIEVTGP